MFAMRCTSFASRGSSSPKVLPLPCDRTPSTITKLTIKFKTKHRAKGGPAAITLQNLAPKTTKCKPKTTKCAHTRKKEKTIQIPTLRCAGAEVLQLGERPLDQGLGPERAVDPRDGEPRDPAPEGREVVVQIGAPPVQLRGEAGRPRQVPAAREVRVEERHVLRGELGGAGRQERVVGVGVGSIHRGMGGRPP